MSSGVILQGVIQWMHAKWVVNSRTHFLVRRMCVHSLPHWNKTLQYFLHCQWVLRNGGSRTSWSLAPIPEAFANPLFGIILAKDYMKMEKIGMTSRSATVYLCMPLLQEPQRLSWYSTWSPRRTCSFTVPRPMQRSQLLVPVPAHLSHDWLPNPLHWWHICGIEVRTMEPPFVQEMLFSC